MKHNNTVQWRTLEEVWGVEIPLVSKVNCPKAVRAVISKQLGQNLPRIILKPYRLVGIVVKDIAISAGMGGSRGDEPPPTSHF